MEYLLGKEMRPDKVKKGFIGNCEKEVASFELNSQRFREIKLVNTKECPICKYKKFESFAKVRDLSWVVCLNCTHHFALKYPDANNLKLFYEEYSDDGKLEPYRIEDDGTLKYRLENVDKPKYESITKIKGRAGSWLDIGAGLGNMLHLAKNDGWDVCGLELSQFQADYAKEKYNIDLIQKDVIPFYNEDATKTFDVITAMGYLDLIEDPIHSLSIIRKMIKKDGLLVVSTPNANSFSAKLLQLWPESTIRLCTPVDRSLFTEKSLTYALREAGFEPFKCWYFGLDYFDFYLHLSIKNTGFKNSEAGKILLESFNEFQAVIDKNKLSDGMIIYSRANA